MTDDYFDQIYSAYMGKIYRYCLFRTNSYQDAEDVTAEVFIKFLANQSRVKQDLVLPWLFKVAGNLCINHNRKANRIQPLDEQYDLTYEHNHPWGDERVWQALRCLNPKQQQVIYLKVIEDMGFKEIASFLNKRKGAVKMLFYRGIKVMENILKEDYNNGLNREEN